MSEVLFSPYQKQEEFINAAFSGKYSFLCYGGSVGGGKTFVSLAILLMMCRIYPNSLWVVIRESVPSLKRTTIRSIKKILPTGFVKSWNQTDYTLTFKNGSQIMFMAEDWQNDKDFDKFKGLEVNGFLLEQIEELQKGLLDVCIIRAGRNKLPKMPPPLILATVNPTQNWVKEDIYIKAIQNKLPSDWFYLAASIMDNPALSEDQAYMSRLTNLDEITYRRLIEGDWSAFAVNNPYAYAFDENKHCYPEGDKLHENPYAFAHDPHAEVMLSFDFNVSPMTCIAAQEVDGRIRFIKEYRLMNSGSAEVCERIKADFPYALLKVTGDATGQGRSAITGGTLNNWTVIQSSLNLGDGQMMQPSINPDHKDGRTLVNSILQNWPPQYNAECKYLIEDLKYVETDEYGEITTYKRKNPLRAHHIDCHTYLLNTFYGDFLSIGRAE